MNVVYKNHLFFFLLALPVVFFNACKEDITPVSIDRFDRHLFNINTPDTFAHFKALSKQYGFFYQSFAEEMLNISKEEAPDFYAPSMSKFVNVPGIKLLKNEVDSVYPDLLEQEADLSAAMFHYHKNFPDERIPHFISFISEFYSANVIYDTIIGLGLDMYLGNKYALYHMLEFPDFMINKLRKEYIVPNAVKSMAIGKYEAQLKDKRFIAMMLFEGKLHYYFKCR